MNRLLTFVALMATLSLTSAASASSKALFSAIDARLELMDEVAAYKWSNHLAIEDLTREEVVLDDAAGSAQALGLDPATSRFFFQLQIEAAKEIQRAWFERFAMGDPVPQVPDLNEVVRPRLIELGQEITAQIAVTPIDANEQALFLSTVNVDGLSDAMELTLFRGLAEIRRIQNRLARIRLTRRLRVGTTGDYAPFSLAPDGEAAEFDGIDIEMARDLARFLDVELELVRTSWPTLMIDLANNRFDIGMGGISVNAERAKTAYFSIPYYKGGKTPIARCTDVERFNRFNKINTEGVKVIVNPGGTNYRFAKANITRADLLVHEDNRTIFDEIANGNADVMITDAIEVTLKSRQIPELCPTLPGKTLTKLEKAYLLPQDDALKAAVDQWLAARLEDGTFRRYYEAVMRQALVVSDAFPNASPAPAHPAGTR